MTLSQVGQPCNVSVTIDSYDGNTSNSKKGSNHGMLVLRDALRAGMTPIASLWGANDMLWLDGKGSKKLGPCEKDSESNCPNQAAMYDFRLEELPPEAEAWPTSVWLLIGLVALAAVAAALYWGNSMMNQDDGSHDQLSEEESEQSSE